MAKKTKAGRPPGSPNKEYATVEEIPATCLKCGSTKLARIPGSKEIIRELAGTLRSGLEYTRVVWKRKRCECGQVLTVRSFLQVPAPTKN